MNFGILIPYPFEIKDDLITKQQHREIVKRHYDFRKWLAEHSVNGYTIPIEFDQHGIAVQFEEEEDFNDFSNYIEQYELTLYN